MVVTGEVRPERGIGGTIGGTRRGGRKRGGWGGYQGTNAGGISITLSTICVQIIFPM